MDRRPFNIGQGRNREVEVGDDSKQRDAERQQRRRNRATDELLGEIHASASCVRDAPARGARAEDASIRDASPIRRRELKRRSKRAKNR